MKKFTKNNFKQNLLLSYFNITFISFYYYIFNLTNLNIFIILNFVLLVWNFEFILKYLRNFKLIFQNLNFYIKLVIFFLSTFYILNILSFFVNIELINKYNFLQLWEIKIITPEILVIPIIIYALIYFSTDQNFQFLINKLEYLLIIAHILYTLTIIEIILFEQNQIGSWGQPLLFLSYLGDSMSSKLQHAYIFFTICFVYFVKYINKKSSLKKNILISYSIFLLLLINSKMFYVLFFILITYCLIIEFKNQYNVLIKKVMQIFIIFTSL